jgi:hypothetical protein
MTKRRGALDSQRGQALIETVICVPLFLFGLFGVIWAIQLGVQYERVEGAVRYAGLVSETINPYTDYSLYSMYGQLSVTSIAPNPCATPIASALSYGAPYTVTSPLASAASQTVTASPPFWDPSTTPSTSCSQNFGAGSGLHGSAAGTPDDPQYAPHLQVEDYLFSAIQPKITSTVAVPSFLSSVLGTSTSTASTGEWFWRGLTIQQIMYCYQQVGQTWPVSAAPSLNEQANKSLKWNLPVNDPSTAATSTPMPSTVSAVIIPVSTNCVTR